MIKEIEIQGCVTVSEEVSEDDFFDKFIGFIEENGGVSVAVFALL